jgi:hypothetical protein
MHLCHISLTNVNAKYCWQSFTIYPSSFVCIVPDLPLCLGVLKHRVPFARRTHLPANLFFYDGILLIGCNSNFEGVLIRSDSRHNDRVDSLWECATKQAVMTVVYIETKLLGGLWLLAKTMFKMDSCLCGAILNLTAFCSIWTLIEGCSCMDTWAVKNNTAA